MFEFNFEKFKEVCRYGRTTMHLLDITGMDERDIFMTFVTQHNIRISGYALDIGYAVWNVSSIWGIDPNECFNNVEIHDVSEFIFSTIQVNDDDLLDFLGV